MVSKGVRVTNHENTIPIVSNSVAKQVRWHTLVANHVAHGSKAKAKAKAKGPVWQQYGLEALRGRRVQLRFLMAGTKLYSYSIV